MMNVVFSQLIGFLLAFMEISLCYLLASDILLEKKFLNRKEKVLLVSTVVILSLMLAYNRKIVFISYTMLLFFVSSTWIIFFVIRRKSAVIIGGIVTACYLLIALTEIFLAFMSMMFLNQKFNYMIYSYATSMWKDVIYLCSGILFWYLYYLVKKRKILEHINIESYRNVLIIWDIVMISVFVQYQRILEKMSVGEQKMQGTTAGMTLLLFVGISSFVGIFFMKYRIIQEENRNYLIRDEIYKRNCDEMEHILQLNRETIHNLKNHLWVMRRMGEKRDVVRLNEYIEVLCQEFGGIEEQKWTGNHVLDMVLSQKKVTAEQKKIKVDIDAMLLPKICINDVEVCALFGNLLDNSIEACEKVKTIDRIINVKIEMKEELLFIKIVNSIKDIPIIKNGELISTKSDKELHGFGIKSVKRIVNRYDGVMTYQVSDSTFGVVVTFFNMLSKT